jgi:site-specific DNA recombinase
MIKSQSQAKYILYARKSTESEDRQVLSIESQIAELKDLARREGLQIVRVMQESRSAKQLGRPIFGEMIERIGRGEASGILCWKLDRLARNFVDGGQVIEMIQRGVIQHIRSFERSYYPEDNVLLMAVELGMANQFSRDLAVNVKRGMRTKAQMGWYPVQPPLGYLNSKSNEKGSNTILVDTERFPAVRRLWDMMLTGGYTPSALWRIANDELNLRTRQGLKIARSNMYRLFTNPFYYGSYEWPRGSGNWYQGKHKPMVTPEEYDRVQTILGINGRPRPKRHVFAFVGMMKCGECGLSITAESRTKIQKNGNVHNYTYYHCTKKRAPCSQGSIEEASLNAQIIECLGSLKIPDEFHRWAMKWLQHENAKEVEIREGVRATRQRAYDQAVRMLDRYTDMRAREELTEEEYRVKKALALKEKARCIAFLNDTDGRITSWADAFETALHFVAYAKDEFEKGDVEKRRRILLALGSNLTLKDKKLRIDLEKTLLPMQRLASAVRDIHAALEPQKDRMAAAHFERLYEESPIVSALRDDVRTSCMAAAGVQSPLYATVLQLAA